MKFILILLSILYSLNATDYLKEKEKSMNKARKLSSYKISKQIDYWKIESRNNNSIWSLNIKTAYYLTVLEERFQKSEPLGSYYFALHRIGVCSVEDKLEYNSKECYNEVKQGFNTASKGNIPEATSAIGLMYELGVGVTKSKLIASKWYLNAAKEFRGHGNDDMYLLNLENSLKMFPENKEANKLLKNYFSTNKI